MPILPRGGGTSLAGQCCNVAVVIDTSRYLHSLIHIDSARREARVQSGLVLDDLQRVASRLGLMFGPDPATHAPVIVLQPSCFAVFRDEARNLFPGAPMAARLADRAVLLDSFIRPHFERGDLPPLAGDALVHLHCHQKALVGADATAATLCAARLKARLLDAGCCGISGSFGCDKQHYKVSLDIGERALLPAVREAPPETLVIADGFSCREQVRQAVGRRAYHFVEVVRSGLDTRSA